MAERPKQKKAPVGLNEIIDAISKLSDDEKQILKMHLYSDSLLKQLKAFESELKKRRKIVKKSDAEIVALIHSIRKKNKTAAHSLE